MPNKPGITAIDSHTAGEPTRVVVSGFPDLGRGPVAERLLVFRQKYDLLRTAIVCEPRGHNAIVGAILCEPADLSCDVGVIFFNNVGYLGMCGHGTIGVVKTLAHLGRISTGDLQIETPVGPVSARLDDDGSVTIENVASYRYKKDVTVEVGTYGTVSGDIAYGGNWFYLINSHSQRIDPASLAELTAFASAVRNALAANNVTGADGAEIDHIEVFSSTPTADSRNFVLCPGLEYDRSPCGTGTSAKLACLYEDGKLQEGAIWRQESIIGSVFEGWVTISNGQIIPSIRGTAHVMGEIALLFDEADPFRYGITN